jgi:hypothetical protein
MGKVERSFHNGMNVWNYPEKLWDGKRWLVQVVDLGTELVAHATCLGQTDKYHVSSSRSPVRAALECLAFGQSFPGGQCEQPIILAP